jgi:hypothetical protein
MSGDKYYENACPSCGKDKLSRRRDVGKICKVCNMREIEAKYRHMKIKQDKPTTAEHCKKTREKYRHTPAYRLNKILQQAKTRAKAQNVECTLTLEDILAMYPKDGLCPVFGVPLKFGDRYDRTYSPSLDRFNPNGGYTVENVRVISWKANRLKSNATLIELEAVVKYMKT